MSETIHSGAAYFVSGGTVPPGSPSYVERATDGQLLQTLLAGEYAYVLNSRQMGKSSLAVRTIGKLGDAGVRTAFVDLTKLGTSGVSEEQWTAGLLAEVARALSLRPQLVAHLKESAALSPAQRLFTFLQDVVARLESPVVLIVDEVDAVRSLGFSTDSFFAGIRQCQNGRSTEPHLRNLTFCLMGAALPGDLIRDVRVTPFNVGRRIELRDFTREEAAALAAGLGPNGATVAQRVWDWTGGHPYLTQALCAELAVGGPSPLTPLPRRGEGDVDALVRARYLDARARDADANLADVANRLLGRDESDEFRADVLSTYERMLRGKPVADDEANPAAARIKMSGIARVEDGLLKPRNRIYATVFGLGWVRDNMPGQELRRQRRAFRRGVARASAVAGLVVASMGALAAVAIRNANLAHEAEKKALASEARAKASERVAKVSEGRAKESEGRAVRSAEEAKRRARSEAVAKRAAQRSAKAALAANGLAQRNLLLAKAAGRRATLAAVAERTQRLVAQRLALAEHAARTQATASAILARSNELLARQNEREARRLLYATNMNLTSQMLDHGSGLQMAEYLKAAKPAREKAAGAGWEGRHFEARLHEAREVQTSGDRIMKVAFSPGGRLLANDLTMRVSIWDLESGRLIVRRQPTDIPGGVAAGMSAFDGTVALSKSDGSIEVRSPEDYSLVRSIPGQGIPIEMVDMPKTPGVMTGWLGPNWTLIDLNTGRFSPTVDGQGYVPAPSIVLPRGDLLQTRNGTLVRTATKGDPGSVRWQNPGRMNTIKVTEASADGRFVAYGDWTGHVQVVDGTTGLPIGPTVTHDAPVMVIAFNPAGTEIATGSADGNVTVYRIADGAVVRDFRSGVSDVSCLAFSAEGDRLAFGTGGGRVGFYDLESFAGPAAALSVGGAWMNSVAVSPDGSTIAAGTVVDQSVRLFDARTGKPRAILPAGPEDLVVRFAPNGEWLAAVGAREADGKTSLLRIWDAKSHALRKVPVVPMERAKLAISPDSRWIFVFEGQVSSFNVVANSTCALYEAATGSRIGLSVKGTGLVYEAAFSPDGRRIGLSWEGGKIAMLDARDLHVVASIDKDASAKSGADAYADIPLACAFTPDGKRFLVGRGAGEIRVYDATTLKSLGSWVAHTGRVLSMAFTEDGRTLLTGSDDRRLRMWETGTWQGLGQVTLPSPIYPMAYSAKGTEAFAGAFDGRVYALRTRYAPEPPPVASPPQPRRDYDAALAESRRTGKPIFFPFFNGFSSRDRSLRSFLMDPENDRIVRRHFTLFDPWQEEAVTYRGRSMSSRALYAELAPKAPPTGYMAFGSEDGRLLFDGKADAVSGHAGAVLSSPQEDWEIESFLRSLRALAPRITDDEIATVRRYMASSARPFLEAKARTERIKALTEGRVADYRARRYERVAAQTDDLIALMPNQDGWRLDGAHDVARLEHWSEAAERYRAVLGSLHPVVDPKFFLHQVCLAMAGDMVRFRTAMRLPFVRPDDYFRDAALMDEIMALALAEGASDDPRAEASRLSREYATELQNPQNVDARLRFALVTLRAGAAQEAERMTRAVMREPVWGLQDGPVRRLGHGVIAVILARSGNPEEARRELAIAEGAFDRRYTDGELVGGADIKIGGQDVDRMWTAEYAVYRKEVETLLGNAEIADRVTASGDDTTRGIQAASEATSVSNPQAF